MVHQHFKLVFGLAILLFSITLSATPRTLAQENTVTQSLIVVGDSAESAHAAAHAVGAEITHQLNVINAVAAEMTETQAARLAVDPRVQAIKVNRTAFTGDAIHTQRDNFSTVAYNNNDGTSNFRSDWIERNDDNDPSSGKVVIWWGAAFLKGENVRFRRHANLENAVNVILSFDYNRYGFDDEDDYVVVEIKYEGDWIELDRFADRDTDNWGDDHAEYDISQYVSNSTRIRFRTSRQLADNDTFKLDNFQIRYGIDDGSGIETVVVSDDFDKQTFDGNSGTGAWSSGWVEENDYGSAFFGDIVVWQGSLRLDGSDNSVRRMADLTDATSATLTFAYQATTSQYGGYYDDDSSSTDPNEIYVAVEVSADHGTTWTEIDRLIGETESFQTLSHDLATFIGNEIMLRFATSEQTTNANNVEIDFVTIEYIAEQQVEPDADPFETPVSISVEADKLHEAGVTGAGVTVAIIDTGFLNVDDLNLGSNGQLRVLAQYDAVADVEALPTGVLEILSDDESGHGAHITSIIANSAQNAAGKFLGVAPDVNLMTVKAFSADGAATYADVIRAIDKVIEHKDALNIRVLNLSFYSTPQSHYWEDPLAQAVMRAWEAGIVVVTGAGNTGPDPLTIGVPGNVPYVITVGAITDNYTPFDTSDDYIPPFSAAGPTFDGFLKPEMLAPGAHVLGRVGASSTLAQTYPQFAEANSYFSLSGTSMSAAVTSGIVALMLEADPTLTPDDVKCRLIDTARAAIDEQGDLAFSIFQQGAGVVNAYDAVSSTASGCANGGLDIAADLAGTEHYVGAVEVNAAGEYFVRDENGGENLNWDGEYAGSGANYIWSGANYIWSGANYIWSGASYIWSGANYIWSGSNNLWAGANYIWSGAELDPALNTVSVSIILDE